MESQIRFSLPEEEKVWGNTNETQIASVRALPPTLGASSESKGSGKKCFLSQAISQDCSCSLSTFKCL